MTTSGDIGRPSVPFHIFPGLAARGGKFWRLPGGTIRLFGRSLPSRFFMLRSGRICRWKTCRCRAGIIPWAWRRSVGQRDIDSGRFCLKLWRDGYREPIEPARRRRHRNAEMLATAGWRRRYLERQGARRLRCLPKVSDLPPRKTKPTELRRTLFALPPRCVTVRASRFPDRRLTARWPGCFGDLRAWD